MKEIKFKFDIGDTVYTISYSENFEEWNVDDPCTIVDRAYFDNEEKCAIFYNKIGGLDSDSDIFELSEDDCFASFEDALNAANRCPFRQTWQ